MAAFPAVHLDALTKDWSARKESHGGYYPYTAPAELVLLRQQLWDSCIGTRRTLLSFSSVFPEPAATCDAEIVKEYHLVCTADPCGEGE